MAKAEAVEQASSNSWYGALFGALGMMALGVLRWWPRYRKSQQDESVGLATVYSAGLQQMLVSYREEIQQLREEVSELRGENEKLRDELAALREKVDTGGTR